MTYYNDNPFSDLVGRTITEINGLESGSESVTFNLADGGLAHMWHSQDGCEGVSVEDVVGDVSDLIGSPILVAEEVTNSDSNPEGITKEYQDSFTWTFYKLATAKGWVTIRWYGASNGYYSESVSFRIDRAAPPANEGERKP